MVAKYSNIKIKSRIFGTTFSNSKTTLLIQIIGYLNRNKRAEANEIRSRESRGIANRNRIKNVGDFGFYEPLFQFLKLLMQNYSLTM